MRRLLCVFALCIATAPGLADEIAHYTAEVAAWNIGGFYQIPESRLKEIAKAIGELDAEIVALSEVNPVGATTTMADQNMTPRARATCV